MHMKISSAKWRPFGPGGGGVEIELMFSTVGYDMTLRQAYPPMAKIHIAVTPFAKALDLRHKSQEFLVWCQLFL